MRLSRIFFILTLSAVIFSSCKNFKEISVSNIDNFSIKQLTPEGITAEVKVKISNPNSIGFNIYRSPCDVYYGETYLGKAKLSKKTHVAPNSNSEHTFIIEGKFKDVNLATITSLISGRSQNLELKGHLKAGKFFYKKKFPIDKNQKINLSR